MQMFYVIVGSGKIDNHKVLKFCIKIETDKNVLLDKVQMMHYMMVLNY